MSDEPELQAYVANLVSALGGTDVVGPSGEYKLGDEALGCLRDLKKWLQFYDAKLNRWDVARCISETTLVSTDVVEILTQWEMQKRARTMSSANIDDRIALACLEILVPLTWPLDLDTEGATTQNHIKAAPFLHRAHRQYKRALLTHSGHVVLMAVLRLASQPMAVELSQRSARGEGILKLALTFFRNLLAIAAEGTGRDGDDADDVGPSSTIEEFSRQKVLNFFVTLGAGMGTEFDTQDVLLLECLYHLTKGVDVERLYVNGQRETHLLDRDLGDLLEAEKQLRAAVFQPSRHSRFGTMLSMKMPNSTGNGDRLSVSGQEGLSGSPEHALAYIDANKKWRKPVRKTVKDKGHWDLVVHLRPDIRRELAKFTSRFIDASFNPLFIKLRKHVERDSDRMSETHRVQFFYCTGWFLRAHTQHSEGLNIDFKLVGGVLNRPMFTAIMTSMRRAIDPGEFQSMDLMMASMGCLQQVLVIIKLMSKSPDVECCDVAESMKARLFYEESWLSLLCSVSRYNSSQPLAYSVEAIELTHQLLKMLDEYSNQHTYVFVKAQRAAARRATSTERATYSDVPESGDEEEVHHEATRVTRERRFEFKRFISRYAHEKTVDTYERVLSQFRDLKGEPLKHCFVFFHRVFAKAEFRAVFFRLTLMRRLVQLTSTREGLGPDHIVRPIAMNFLQYYTNKLVKHLQKTPSLYVELLFDKLPGDSHYFDTGRERPSLKHPKFEYEYTEDLSIPRQVAILVNVLQDRENGDDVIGAIEETLTSIATERGIKETRALPVPKHTVREWLQDGIIRLLLRTAGLHVAPREVHVPAAIDALRLIEVVENIQACRKSPLIFEDGRVAMDFLRRTDDFAAAASDGDAGDSDDEDYTTKFADPRLQLNAEGIAARQALLEAAKAQNPSRQGNKKRERKKQKGARLLDGTEVQGTRERSHFISDTFQNSNLAKSQEEDSENDAVTGDQSNGDSATADTSPLSSPHSKRRRILIDDLDSD